MSSKFPICCYSMLRKRIKPLEFLSSQDPSMGVGGVGLEFTSMSDVDDKASLVCPRSKTLDKPISIMESCEQ